MIASLNIDYDGFSQASYKRVQLKVGKKTYNFDTGDPVVDFKAANSKADELVNSGKVEIVMCSSSLDHFTMDGDKYRWEIVGDYELLRENK